MFEKCKYKWDYTPTKEKEDGYQNLIQQYPFNDPEKFSSLSEEQQNKEVDNLIKRIREINIFPVFYFNEEGIKKEILSVINKKGICFNEDNDLITQSTEGSLLLDYMFPNLHHVVAGHKSNLSIYDTFYDDEKLKICLLSFLKVRKLYSLRTAFFSRSRYIWNAATNFSPIRAKAIYENFCPKNGIIYDYSAGFGGRMLGALSSKNNYTYIATEPNSDTYYNLIQLGQKIQNVTKRKDSFKIYNLCSEDFLPTQKIDFAFSCPPFFDLEKYSEEETQSIIKFPKYDDWLEYYVRLTIRNCFNSLKQDGIFAIDLMNYFKSSQKVNLIEDWVKIAEEQGFILRQVCNIVNRSRKKYDEDKEKIFVFTKNKQTPIKQQISKEEKQIYQKRIKENQLKKLRKEKRYCVYNGITGELQNQFSSLEDMSQTFNLTIDEVKSFIKTKKKYDKFVFKVYKGDQAIIEKLDFKKIICKIDNIYFDSYAQAGRYLKVSRQAVYQSKQKNSSEIKNHKIIWYN